jgi:phosphatidylinositol 4-kinase type 2
MPRNRPATTGYERIAQADEFEDDSDLEDDLAAGASLQPSSSGPRYASIVAPRPQASMQPSASASNNVSRPTRARRRASSGVDLKAINARLERWAEEIASKFKRGRSRKQADEEEGKLEIQHSVFQAPDGVRPVTPEFLSKEEPGYMSREEFERTVEGVRVAMEHGVHPRMISKGSSGSYFAQNIEGKIVGVFKPKDEEPYAAGNPKWNKWIHRNLFPCCFGRAW